MLPPAVLASPYLASMPVRPATARPGGVEDELCYVSSSMAERRPIPVEEARATAERAARHLATDRRVRLVYLFGSAADVSPPEGVGDIDLAILTAPPLDLEERLRLGADLGEFAGPGLELVSLNEAPVVLAHEVAAHGRCLYADPPEAETDFVLRARARHRDFRPYLERQWRLAGERLEGRLRGPQG